MNEVKAENAENAQVYKGMTDDDELFSSPEKSHPLRRSRFARKTEVKTSFDDSENDPREVGDAECKNCIEDASVKKKLELEAFELQKKVAKTQKQRMNLQLDLYSKIVEVGRTNCEN